MVKIGYFALASKMGDPHLGSWQNSRECRRKHRDKEATFGYMKTGMIRKGLSKIVHLKNLFELLVKLCPGC